jgi:hypothetical protein
MQFTKKVLHSLLLVIVLTLTTVGTALANSITGPSSSQSPYLLRKPYRLVGITDGLGAFDNGDGTFTLLVNHEIPNGLGEIRAHGAPGAFVSKWIVSTKDLTVLSGEDLIESVLVWNTTTHQYELATVAQKTLLRLCSADLPEVSAFYDSASGLGYNGRIFMNGEESGSEGRAFAHFLDGTSYEVPWLGKFSWENSIANPATGISTVVAGTDDTTGGQVYFYVGKKTFSSNPVDAAGLTNGNLFSIKVDGLDTEDNSTVLSGPTPFTAYNFGDVSAWTGAQLEAASKDASGAFRVTSFNRPEDGAWDPNNPNDFYFVTTASFTGMSRLWRVHFNDPANPAAGGTVEILLDGSEGQKMMDNLTINHRGQLVIQEDPGNQPYFAKIWLYDIAKDKLTEIAHHDPDRFAPGATNFLTQDEESSGIIDASSILGEGWYLLDQQAHYAIPGELVEGGQLLALHISTGKNSK